MDDFLERFSQTNLGFLRSSERSGMAENNTEIVPGIYLSWDAEETGLTVEYNSPGWAALTLSYQRSAAPRWFSLNLALAEGLIAEGDVLGLVVEGYSAQSASISLRLRSMIEGETFDSDWSDTINLHPSNDVAVALRSFAVVDGLVGREGYHTLIMSLPRENGSLTIRNMRLFRMPGSRELRRDPETLASFAV